MVDITMNTLYELQSLVHNPQHLQLCAIHTLNNLLQLSPSDNDGHFGEVDGTRMVLINGRIFNGQDITIRSNGHDIAKLI